MPKKVKVDTWMPLLVDKYLGDTTHLTTQQHGAYLLLLMSAWKKDGRLPSSDEQMRNITRLDSKAWAGSRAVLLEFFALEDGSYVQKRLSSELVRAKANSDQRSRAGKASAEKREAQRKANETATDVERDAPRNSIPIPTPSSEANASDGKPADDSPKAELWRAAVSVLEAGGCPKAQCRTFMGKLVGDYTFPVVQQAVAAAVTHQPADAREYLKATCQRLKGERVDPITVPSDAHEKTAAYLAEVDKAKAEMTPPPADLMRRLGRAA
jgi:uncharacterized protein YdaU (DUF1376 family)